MSPRFLSTVGLALLAAACNASPPGPEEATTDAGMVGDLAAPRVEAPDATPLDVVALRGVAVGANRVVIKAEGIADRIVTTEITGDFCVDAKLGEGTTSFDVYGIAKDGRISEASTVKVKRDPSIAEPPAATCRAQDECDQPEDCSNGADDDCDGLVDDHDGDCNGCVDDYLEPNDGPGNVPTLTPATYELMLCPYREDWFAFDREFGQQISISATFVGTEIDVDLKLFKADRLTNMNAAPVAMSLGYENSEMITYSADEDGTYYLQIYGPEMKQGGYDLVVH